MTRIAILGAFAFCALSAAASENIEFSTVDSDGDGLVSEREFVTWKTSLGNASPAEALVQFIETDTDASGMISKAEMDAAMATADEKSDSASDQMK